VYTPARFVFGPYPYPCKTGVTRARARDGDAAAPSRR
jgi:hypothetical protein